MTQIIDAEIRLKDRLSGKLRDIRSNLLQSTKVIDRFGKSVKRVGKKIEKFGTNFSKKVSAPVLGLGTASLVAASNFEQGMLKIKNVTQATSEQLDIFKQKALDLSLRSTKTPTEIAEGMSFLGLAGWSDNQILENFEPILRASESSGLDLKTMSDLVTDSLSAFGLAAEDTSDFLNKLSKASIKANTDVGQALEGILGSGGMAKQLGLTVEEYGATLGVLANRGIKASEAGTALNSIFVNLLGTSATTKKALDELGVAVYDAQGNFVGWENLLESLSSSMESLTDEQRNLFSAMLGGKTQLDTLLALLSGYRGEYKDLKKEIGDIYVFDEVGNKLKILDKMSADQLSTTAGRFAQLKNSVSVALIELGEAVAPIILPMLEKITSFVQTLTAKWESLGEDGQKTVVKIAGGLALFGLGATVIGKMIKGVGSLISSFKFLLPFVTSIGKLLAPILNGPAGVFLLILGLIPIIKDDINKLISDIWGIFNSLFKGLNSLIEGIFTLDIKKIGDSLMKVAKIILNFIASIVSHIINAGISLVNALIGLINKIPFINLPKINKIENTTPFKYEGAVSNKVGKQNTENILAITKPTSDDGRIRPSLAEAGKILGNNTKNLVSNKNNQSKNNNINININKAEFKNDMDAERLAKIINDKLQRDMHNTA